jgi:hypothetical protein
MFREIVAKPIRHIRINLFIVPSLSNPPNPPLLPACRQAGRGERGD